jgi:hypothetical protein
MAVKVRMVEPRGTIFQCTGALEAQSALLPLSLPNLPTFRLNNNPNPPPDKQASYPSTLHIFDLIPFSPCGVTKSFQNTRHPMQLLPSSTAFSKISPI